jgi:hypothetical protein
MDRTINELQDESSLSDQFNGSGRESAMSRKLKMHGAECRKAVILER